MNITNRNRLIDELLDGEISEADFLVLEAEMRVNPEAREAYYDRMKLYRALGSEASRLEPLKDSASIPFLSRHARSILSVVAAALLAFAGLVGWQMGQRTEVGTVADAEPTASGFATIAEQSDAEWANGIRLERGDLLPQGHLELRSGMVQLELFSGVRVILEGECAFEIRSPMEMELTKGDMRALVPQPARGFKVATTSGEVVDLGTEFALSVDEVKADMHVLQGEIEWRPQQQPMRLLVNGQSMRWNHSGEGGSLVLDPQSLPLMGDLEQRFIDHRSERRDAWIQERERIQSDPRLVAYYPIDVDSNRLLTDVTGSGLHGTVVIARRDVDRWDRSGSALNFSPTGSRVRVFIPGEHRSLTFYCWARIDSLDRKYNSLFLTDGHELNEPHWQIMDDGRLFFSVKRRERNDKFMDKHIAYSPSFWDPSLSGKWFQIASVYDVDAQTTTHYVNGEAISIDQISDDYIVDTVRIGAASIGNWNEPTRSDPNFALRNLNGAIDEFAIFDEALSASEIAELYRKGRP